MKLQKLFTTAVSAMALSWALAANQAHAQQAPSPAEDAAAGAGTNMQELVVTSRRSAERLQDVPLSINAVTQAQLQARGITDLNGLARYTPSFSFKDYVTAFHGNPVIRGMTQQNTVDPVTNVGVFMDGVYLQRDYQQSQSLGDFSRIEVVKGPQSALYGANTFAGAVNYVTNQPTDYYTANGEATVGTAGSRRFQAAVGGPVIKGILDARLYTGVDQYDGTLTNNAPAANTGRTSHFADHDRRAYSGALKFTPTENLTFTAFYTHSNKAEGLRPYYSINGASLEQKANCGPVSSFTGRPQLFCGTFSADPDVYSTGVGQAPKGLYANIEPALLAQNDVWRIGAEWRLNSALTLHYTYGGTRGSASEDFSYFENNYNPTPANFLATTFSQQFEGAAIHYDSHEVRLNYDAGKALKFEVGAFHSSSDDRYFLGFQFVPITGGVVPALPRYSADALSMPPASSGRATTLLTNLDETFDVNAIFGRASYTFLNDRATIAGEIRYSQTKLNYHNLFSTTTPTLSATFNDPVPRFTAEYKLSPQNLLYASAAEGIKTGGFNGYVSGTVTLLPSERSYGEEKNWTYELGSKNTFLDHTLTFNVDVFYIDWPQKQAQVAPANAPVFANGAPVTSQSIYRIAGSATNYGIEFEGQWRPIKPLTFEFSGAAQNPRFGKGTINTTFLQYCSAPLCSATGDISGKSLERESKLSGTLGAEYRDHLSKDWDYFGGVDVTYQSLQYADQLNLSMIGAYALVNGRIGVANGPYRAMLWVKNLGDMRYVDNSFYSPSLKLYTASLGEGRTVGVTLTGSF